MFTFEFQCSVSISKIACVYTGKQFPRIQKKAMLQVVLIPNNPFVFADENFKTVKREMYVFKRLKLRF